jgi:hypothetical protein
MIYPSGTKVLKAKVEAIDHRFPNQWKTLYGVLTKVGPFQGLINLQLVLSTILLMNDTTKSSTIFFSIYGP